MHIDLCTKNTSLLKQLIKHKIKVTDTIIFYRTLKYEVVDILTDVGLIFSHTKAITKNNQEPIMIATIKTRQLHSYFTSRTTFNSDYYNQFVEQFVETRNIASGDTSADSQFRISRPSRPQPQPTRGRRANTLYFDDLNHTDNADNAAYISADLRRNPDNTALRFIVNDRPVAFTDGITATSNTQLALNELTRIARFDFSRDAIPQDRQYSASDGQWDVPVSPMRAMDAAAYRELYMWNRNNAND